MYRCMVRIRAFENAAEEASLTAYMRHLADNRVHRQTMGKLAAEHIAEHQGLDAVVRKYLDILVS